mmetsp:Transcript_114883/g.288858  ORF Transcript_114883/g.288858 Transcript_114883/m.288858 type:complete len:239 (-) Transcript_114883:72-788(-)
MESAQDVRPSPPSSPPLKNCILEAAAFPSAADSAQELLVTIGLVAVGFFSAHRFLRLGQGVGHRRARSAFPAAEKDAEDDGTMASLAGNADCPRTLDILQLKAHDACNRNSSLQMPEDSGTVWEPGAVWVSKESADDADTMSPSGCSDDMVDEAVYAQEDSEISGCCDRWLEAVLSLENDDLPGSEELIAPVQPSAARASLQTASAEPLPWDEDDESGGAPLQRAGLQLATLWRISLL